MGFNFNYKYLFLTIFIFLIELFIALFVKDKIIRPFVGDVLVVILIYSFIRIFISGDYRKLILGVFILSCGVEIAQYFNIVESLGLGKYKWARIIIGTTFSVWDIVAYAIGALLIFPIELKWINNTNHPGF